MTIHDATERERAEHGRFKRDFGVTVSLIFAAALLSVFALAPALIAVGMYLVAGLVVRWSASGAEWQWPYPERERCRRLWTFLYAFVRLSRFVQLGGLTIIAILVTAAMLASVITLGFLLVDFASDRRVSLRPYEHFYVHELPEWFTQAADGHAGDNVKPRGPRNRGELRLEGRDYAVADGDIVTIRFTP